MAYTSLLDSYARKRKSIVCLGLDPVIDRIPIDEKNPGKKIKIFFENILEEIVKRKIYPGAVKPNHAFYAQYGIDGIISLKETIDLYKKEGIPVILDSKRGDIGNTSAAYAKETFEYYGADSVTIAPYMGFDSLSPFSSNYPDKGFYLLCRTSNKSAVDFQNLLVEGEPLYIHVAKKICEWNVPGLGAVIGATYPSELEKILSVFSSYKKEIPLLIPGIGTQGGDISAIMNILKNSGNVYIHRINSSSAILFAHEKRSDVPYYVSSVDEIDKLNSEINPIAGI
jgi:orotidine-5'-phosphate decarboxylase